MDEFVKATAEQEFTLMLHDRLVELEKKVADLEPKPLDPRIKIAERPRHPFVKLEFDAKIDHSTWLKSVVERLGRQFEMRVSGVACQGWSLRAQKYVVEAIFEAGAMDHHEVGRACLETGTAFGEVRAVHVHEVTNVAWFMESIMSADDDAGHATYENGAVSTTTDQTDTPWYHSHWYRLNGWLVSVMENADVEHLQAFDADSAATALYRAH
jgi:hypothetical protein